MRGSVEKSLYMIKSILNQQTKHTFEQVVRFFFIRVVDLLYNECIVNIGLAQARLQGFPPSLVWCVGWSVSHICLKTTKKTDFVRKPLGASKSNS